MFERARQFARNAWFLLRYCTVGVPLSPSEAPPNAPPALEHEWRAILGGDRWEYRHRGDRIATIYRLTESEIDDLGYEKLGAKRWREGFRIEWEWEDHPWLPRESYCGSFDTVRTVCRIYTTG
jgi:hypothetical protein